MTDTHDDDRDRLGHPGDGVDPATQATVDLAVARALDRRVAAPLPEDFARQVGGAAMAEERERRRARRSARVTWTGLAVVALLLLVLAPALAPAATVVFTPLARTLGPVVTDPLVVLALVAVPVFGVLGHALRT